MGFIKQETFVNPNGTSTDLMDSSNAFLSSSNGMLMDVQDPGPTADYADYTTQMGQQDILAYPLVQVQLAEPPRQAPSDNALVTEICSLISKLTPEQLHQVLLLVNSQEPEQMVKSDVEWVFDLNALKPTTCQLVLNFVRAITQPASTQIYAPAPAFYAAPVDSFYQVSPLSYLPPQQPVVNSKKRKEAPLRSSVELMLQETRKRRTQSSEPEDMIVEDASFTGSAPQPQPVVYPEMMPAYTPNHFPSPTSPTTNEATSEEDDVESDTEWAPHGATVASLPGLTRLPNGKFQLEVEVVDLRDAKTGASEWTCPICHRIFTDSSNFNKHTLRHTTEKPAVCTYEGCGKRFTHTSTLKDHIDAIHLQIRKYKCNWPGCNKAFSNQSNKSRHMRTHNGSKPYTCHLCSKSFSQSSNLKVHLKTHDKH